MPRPKPDACATAAEALALLERSGARDALGRRPPTASADLRRAINLIDRLLRRGRRLTPAERVALEAALSRFIVHPLHYTCTPACCDASAIRGRQIWTLAAALARSPSGAAAHGEPIAEALVGHPRWQVRDFLLRAVARARWPSPPPRLVDAVGRAVRPADPAILRAVWQRRALARLGR